MVIMDRVLSTDSGLSSPVALMSAGYGCIRVGVDNLAARVQWARGQVEPKLSMSALSERAGLGRSHVGQIERGAIKGRVDAKTIDAIAKATNVNPLWLWNGTEPRVPYRPMRIPDLEAMPEAMPGRPVSGDIRIETDPRYQNREAVIAYWRHAQPGRWSSKTIQAVRGMQLEPGEEPTTRDWERELDAIEAARGGRATIGADAGQPPRRSKGR
jgi:transcriptional regulator with XRE-family HTH domain